MNSLVLERVTRIPQVLRFEISDRLILLSSNLEIEGFRLPSVPLDIVGLEDARIVVFTNGSILQIKDQSLSEIGVIEDGILACSCSGDQEIIAILNGRGKLLLFNKEFNVINEFHLSDSDSEPSLPTFSIGHAATISWRGDGEFFSVGYRNKLYIYTREGEFVSTSNISCNLVSWKPDGSLIATVKNSEVQFHEKNGLEHGSFDLRMDANQSSDLIADICWSNDSSVLATMTQDRKRIFLWYMCNYHYYLKFELKSELGFEVMKFDPEEPLKIHTISSNGYETYEFKMDILRSVGRSGTVGVIDGNQLALTPFTKANIPPPMSLFQIKFDSQVLNASFGIIAFDKQDPLEAVAVLTRETIKFYIFTPSPVEIGQLDVSNYNPRQIGWAGSRIALQHGMNQVSISIFNIKFAADNVLLDTTHDVIFEENVEVQTLFADFRANCIAIQTTNGEIYELPENDPNIPGFKSVFEKPCRWVQAAIFDDGIAFVGLTSRNNLYLDDRLLISDCTSFLVHDEFLIATTLKHTCRFASLKVSKNDCVFGKLDADTFNEQQRRIEQGAKIVVAAKESVNLVLEMPRGNLETVAPRALVLSQARKLINQSKFLEAFSVCRRHRIDLNFLLDFRWDLFTQQVGSFVQDLSEEYLCLLIAGLRNEDVCVTMYTDPNQKASVSVEEKHRMGKANRACIVIREAIQSFAPSKHQAILCTFAKQNPPNLSDALLSIAKVAESDLKYAETLLKYLIFLADVDVLYKNALSIYNFDLCLMVAQFTQMDPREYLPFLSMLKTLQFNFQRYYINDHLKHYELALEFLVKACDAKEISGGEMGSGEEIQFKDILNYIVKFELYKSALSIYDKNRVEYPKILCAYAEFVSEKRDYNQSAILYEMANAGEQALQEHIKAINWREAISISLSLSKGKEYVISCAKKLAEELAAIGKYQEVFHLYETYIGDKDGAIDALIKGKHWSDARYFVVRAGLGATAWQKIHIASVNCNQGLIIDAKELIEEYGTQRVKFLEKTTKLEQVRKEKIAIIENPANEDSSMSEVQIFDDTASMATTASIISTSRSRYTSMSSKSNATSRSRRKMAKKRETGKDAFYLDEYLMKSIQSIIRKMNEFLRGDEIPSLLQQLMLCHEYQLAKALQRELKNYCSTIKENQQIVFRIQVIERPTVEESEESPSKSIIEPVNLTEHRWWFEALQ